MIRGAQDMNATVIISSQTPGYPYSDGKFIDTLTPWVGYAERAAEASKVPYVDHFEVSRQVSQSLALLTNS